LRIAICDDDSEEIAKIEWAMFSIQGNYQVDTFSDGESLLDAARQGEKYDLLFCDSCLNGENGMNTVRDLQKLSPRTAVVIISAGTDYAVEAFSLRALHYLVKPVRAEDVVEVFRRLGGKQEPRRTLTLRIDRTVNVLYQDEIIRVEGQDHRTVITCMGETVFSIWKPYREICALLDPSFIQIKKGVSVNMRHIRQMTTRECVTRDSSIYLLRRDRAKEIRERYAAFLENDLDGYGQSAAQ